MTARPDLLGALLEDFNPLEPRGFHGKWIGDLKSGTAALRLMNGRTHIADAPHTERRADMVNGVVGAAQRAGSPISHDDASFVVDRVMRSLPPSGDRVRVSPLDPATRGSHDRDVDNSIANQRRHAANGLRFGAPAKIPGSRESAPEVLGALLQEHFSEPMRQAPAPKVKPIPKPDKPKHPHLLNLTDTALRSRLKADSGSSASERQTAAALLQARRDASDKLSAKVAQRQAQQQAAPAAARESVLDFLLS